jgi:3-oxoacyl-[acyl-carrier protein] reductase
MDLGLRNRVVLVTGASRGIGEAIAERLTSEGAKVVISARGRGPLFDLAGRLAQTGAEVLPVVADTSTESGIRDCVDSTITHFGRLDTVVHNAGGAIGRGAIETLNDDHWLDTYEANVMSLVRLVRYAREHLARSDLARIISIASTTASEPGSHDPHYSSAKAALISLGKHLSNALAPDGILVNTVAPGPIRTNSWERFVDGLADIEDPESRDAGKVFESEMASRIPLGRIGESGDVADIVAFLASSRAAWITGSLFRVDGGKSRGVS